MGFDEECIKTSKDVSKMQHLIMDGNNIMVLDMNSCKIGEDVHGQKGWVFKTRKHYCEEFQLTCCNQPINSQVLVKKQVFLRIKDIVIKHFKGKSPDWLPVVINRWDNKKFVKNPKNVKYYYKVIFAYNEDSLDDFIDCIKMRNFKKINELFVIDKELKGWGH